MKWKEKVSSLQISYEVFMNMFFPEVYTELTVMRLVYSHSDFCDL